MDSKKIVPANALKGLIVLPGDKSISHRAVMLGSISQGKTLVKNLLDCADLNYTINAFRDMGIAIDRHGEETVIEGKGLAGLRRPAQPLNAGESGTTMRIVAGILAGQAFDSEIICEPSLKRRPMKRLIDPLSLMGANFSAAQGDFPPLTIRGSALSAIEYPLAIPSAQIKSAILFAGLYAKGTTRVIETSLSRDHTERMMRLFGADVQSEGTRVSVTGKGTLRGQKLSIPGDISSASFFMVAALLIRNSSVRIERVSINSTRAGILSLLARMGAKVRVINTTNDYEVVGDIIAEYGHTKGVIIEEEEIPALIDELPIIFVLASLSKGRTVIKGARELRVKETDRIASMLYNITAMGGRISLEGDTVIIDGVEKLAGADLKSFGDHRTCMAASIAALAAEGMSSIDDCACVNKSFPDYFAVLEKIRTV